MDTINEIHDNVFEFLEEYRKSINNPSVPFLFSLRRSNLELRLEKGYWFHGNENYMAVSFWSGMDWKNKTPNIFIRITTDNTVTLTFTAKDSIQKEFFFEKFFADKLGLTKKGKYTWLKDYTSFDYMASLQSFLNNDKITIDRIIQDNQSLLESEDAKNSIGFITEGDFDKWYSNVAKYRQDHIQRMMPFSLTSFSVENYKPIEKLSLARIPRDVPFIFLVGDNGSGKSSLLKALANALGNKFNKEGYGLGELPWIINFSIAANGKMERGKITGYDAMQEKPLDLPFACYGPSRLIIENRRFGVETSEIVQRKHPLRGIFNADVILLDINRWIVNQLSSSEKNENAKLRYENIKQMLINVIPNLYDIREVEWEGTQELLYFEEDLDGNKNKNGVIYEHLSSGLKSLMAMLGDMMLRLFDQQPEILDPAELGGIVLIDEIDIHLHPKWQKKIPQILNQNFPKVQFIVSTHSPIPLLGAPKESRIYVVKRNMASGISIIRMDDKVMFSEILPNAILTSPIFGLDDITPTAKSEQTQTKVDDDYKEIELYQKLEYDINRFMTNDREKKLIDLFKNER